MKIFISYRREESRHAARLICDRLVSAFGEENIFFDVHELLVAQDFRRGIDTALDSSCVLVVVMGPKWLTIMREKESHGETDWVRYEIEHAFSRGLQVFPLFVDGGTMPGNRDLPGPLEQLTRCNGLPIYEDQQFEASIAIAVAGLRKTIESLHLNVPDGHTGAAALFWDQTEGRKRGRWALGFAAIFLVALMVWREALSPPDIDLAALGHLLYDTCWITYDPPSLALDVNREPVYPRVQLLESDLDLIKAAGFTGLLTSTSRGIMADVPRLAKERGLKVIMGVWNPADRQEVSRAIRAARYADAYCVGHCGIPDRYSISQLRRAVYLIKRRTGHPAAISEQIKGYNPQLAQMGDWLFPDAHLTLKNRPDSLVSTVDVGRDVEVFMTLTETIGATANKLGCPLLLQNVAYPHGGIAGASRSVQAEFFQRLLERLNDPQHGCPVKVAIVAQGAFDCRWKTGRPFLSWDPYTGLIDPYPLTTNRGGRMGQLSRGTLLSPAGLEILRWYPHLMNKGEVNIEAP